MARLKKKKRQGEENGERKNVRNGNIYISYKWMVGLFVGVIMVGGGAWLGNINTDVRSLLGNSSSSGRDLASVKTDLENVKQRVNRIDNNVDEMRKDLGRLAEAVNRKDIR